MVPTTRSAGRTEPVVRRVAHDHPRSDGSGVGTWAYHDGSMATSHRNSHTVPEFYLRAFAENGHVLLAERGGGSPRRVGVRRATAETDFYALRAADGRLLQELEDDVLHRVEREVAPVHRAMRAGLLPIGRHRLTYALFLGLAGVRTRRFRQMGFDAVDPNDADDLGVGEDEFRNHMIRTAMLVLWPKMTRLIALLDWRLLEVPASEGFGFVTADHPVGLWTEDPDRVERVGFLSADAIVHPVDPRRVLVMKRPELSWPRWATSSNSRAISHVNWAMENIAHKDLIMIPRSGAHRLTRIRGRSALRAVTSRGCNSPMRFPSGHRRGRTTTPARRRTTSRRDSSVRSVGGSLRWSPKLPAFPLA